ncbi:sodium:proton antiporter [Candidatus Marinamargulisbacteria bacterium SCGC AG-410-N11]|nr:sodium:proton antiporter [Candidatus Marinamargulisbacteria bacterium SCGC AG-410-N11]
MIWQFDILLLTLVVVCGFVSLWIKDLMGAVIVFGAYSFLMCLVWTGMGAVDVAFTEAAVGAGVSTIFFIATVFHTSRTIRYNKWDLSTKFFSSIICILMGFFLMVAIGDFPAWGDALSPVNNNVAKYYLENSMEETKVPNVVTSVLADYRAFDTMFETGVVFVASLVIFTLLLQSDGRKKLMKSAFQKVSFLNVSESLIIRKACGLMVPFMQLFALYVVVHGHYSPGGGFQGGVILGASLILLSMAYDIKKVFARFHMKFMIKSLAVGVLIFAGIGLICLILGGNFLDYSALSKLFPSMGSIKSRYNAMLWVEVGVALTVMSGMFAIYTSLSSNGKFEEGL